ncbi:MAG: phosphomethylpyrimidine synthase ThiC [Firmicutes bacterium]|nr:phosphomethylpyrimidine synthase ThiC [Bacillota bacterium]
MKINNNASLEQNYDVWLPSDDLMKKIVEQEDLTSDEILAGVKDGTISILASKISVERGEFTPCIVGNGTRKKVCAAIGMDANDVSHFMSDELKVILNSEPNALCDVSIGEEIPEALRSIRDHINIPLGSCPTYDVINAKVKRELTKEKVLEKIEEHLKSGVDFILLHMGLSYKMMDKVLSSNRVMPSTSRGGGAIIRYMKMTEKENPFILYLDDIAKLCKEYQVVLDLGDIFRPGCVQDGDNLMEVDCLKAMEVNHLNQLRQRALSLGVQVVCEAGGHVSLNKITDFVVWLKESLGQAPLFFNGPLPTDRAVGYDSIANAIGVSHAAIHGGDMFLSLSDAEHYAKPTPTQSAQGVRATKVALSTVEYAIGSFFEVRQNHAMGRARQDRQWNEQANTSLFPRISAKLFHENGLVKDLQPCSLCGPLCPLLVN